jgi:antitoxin ParD1/3/4
MNISLPEDLKNWVEEQVTRDSYGTASEYIRHLLREEQKRQARAKVDALLLEGIRSGPSTPMTAKDWSDIRREVRKRHARRNGK